MVLFTSDWVTRHVGHWREWLGHLAGKEDVQGLEIGSHEGRSALWFLDNILTASTANLTCIDPFFADAFYTNIEPYGDKVTAVRQPSHVSLRGLTLHSFDFAYIDGDHSTQSVLEDGVLTFRLLKQGGILIFDDYHWQPTSSPPIQSVPRLGIDCFLASYSSHIRNVVCGYQVKVEKKTSINTSPL